jgi:hypothetical protein
MPRTAAKITQADILPLSPPHGSPLMKTPKKKAAAKKKAPTFEAGMLALNVSIIANTEQEKGNAMHLLEQITSVAQTFGLHVSPTLWLPKSYLLGKPK